MTGARRLDPHMERTLIALAVAVALAAVAVGAFQLFGRIDAIPLIAGVVLALQLLSESGTGSP